MKLKLIAITLLSGIILTACGGARVASQEVTEFAQCLTEQNVVMYGAFWCPHCQREKDLFGTAFDELSYVECDKNGENEQAELCLQKKIQGYPTWVANDGDRVSGFQDFKDLEELSGGECIAPSTES